jgi:hypothetical protein
MVSLQLGNIEETVKIIEESGEHCTVVFALIVTEPVNECVCRWGGGGGVVYTPTPSNRCRTK